MLFCTWQCIHLVFRLFLMSLLVVLSTCRWPLQVLIQRIQGFWVLHQGLSKVSCQTAVRQLSFCQFLSISTSVDLRSLRSAVSPTELDRSQEHSSMAPIVFGERLWGGIAGHQNSDHFEQSIWFRMFRFWRLGGTCFGFHVGFDAWNPTKTYNHPQSSTIRIHMETGGCSRDSHGIWAGLHGWRRSLA